MIKHINGRFVDYSISPKIRQIVLHWAYELTEIYIFLLIEKRVIIVLTNKNYCRKRKGRYYNCCGKEKTDVYYLAI